MIQHLISIFSESVAIPAGFSLLFGVLIHFTLHNWQRVEALSRSRSQLLSVSAFVALLLGILQLYPAAGPAGDGLSLLANAFPRPLGLTAESLAASGLAAVLTYHNDNARTGQNTLETVLTPDTVNPARFGKLYSFPVNGYVYAQPLYMPQVAIPGNGIHNVVIVATQHDSVYAFDADSPAPAPLWQVNFLDRDAGITTLSPADVQASDILPEIGITSTPVIDIASNTVYVVAATKENGAFYHRLHALDMTSGAEKFGGPRIIQASYPGAAQDGSDGVLTFSSRSHLQRAALLLSRGRIYVAFASNADSGLYHGWVIAYDAITLRQTGAWVSTPDGYQGGIWMSGCGIAADRDGNLYLSTANGPFDAYGEQPGQDFSDSIVKLKPGPGEITLTGFFTPFNQESMARDDLDLGSAGVMLLPDQPGPHPHLAITSGKNGHIYVLDRDNLGGYNGATRGNPQIVQEVSRQLKQQMGTPAWWNGHLYFGAGISPQKDSIKAFALHNGTVATVPASQTAAVYHLTRSTVSVSASGSSNGIVWAVDNDAYYAAKQGAAVLHAYDAKNLAHELYNSSQRFGRDNPGPASKFTVPTITNGKVFVGTANQLSVYGLLGAGN
ncbi:MAG TPA: hypothetical protein VL240_00975 [Candidatus Binatia bacterium]|nr:hypothetical protein [Candidatus Binatia bacterium]